MNNIINGVVMGIANIIPGVSGGTMLVTLGIYEKTLDAIKSPFKNFMFLIQLVMGAVIGILLFANLISLVLDVYNVPTMGLVVGLIIGGSIHFYKKEVDIIKPIYVILGLSSLLLQVLVGVSLEVTIISIVLVGILVGASMIVPGISGSLLLLLFGMYEPILEMVKNISITNLTNILMLGMFASSIVVGVLLTVIALKRILKTHRVELLNIVLGLLIGSIIVVFPKEGYDVSSWLLVLTLPTGYFISKLMN